MAEFQISITWHKNWDSEVEIALAQFSMHPLSEPELLRRLWDANLGKIPLKVGIVKSSAGDLVGVVPLKRTGRSAWQLLTYYCMPYAMVLVNPEHVDSAIRLLSADVDCPNLVCPIAPIPTSYMRAEDSWIVDATQTYPQWLEARKYAKMDRRIRRRSEHLQVVHDKYDDLPHALDEWQSKWIKRGSEYTAVGRGDMEIACNYLIEHGRLKTISLYDGDIFVGLGACVLANNTAYHTFNIGLDSYREIYAGIRLELELISWALDSEIQTLDLLRTSNMPKHQWADPKHIGFRLMRCPFGSESLGRLMGSAKDYIHAIRSERSKRLKEQSLTAVSSRNES